MMTLTDYKTLAPEIKVTPGEYDEESCRTESLHGKWLEFYITEAKVLNKLHAQMKVLVHERTKYYTGKTAVPYEYVVLKSELPRYLDADPQIQELQEAIDNQALVVKYINGRLGCIERRGFEIKDAIKWQMFKHGAKF